MLPAGPASMRYAALVLSLFLIAPARTTSAQTGPRQARPKLVVVVVADQMRADYLVRYGGLFEKGLKRLTTDGAWFQNAAYPYMATLTCVGHTTIGFRSLVGVVVVPIGSPVTGGGAVSCASAGPTPSSEADRIADSASWARRIRT